MTTKNRFGNKMYRLLRWSEKYTKADMVYITKGGFWVTFGQTSSGILSLVLIYVFANFLPRETYGFYQYALSIIGILSIFTLRGMNQAVSQSVATGDTGVLRTSVRYQLKWNLLMLAAAVAVSAYYTFNGNIQLAVAIIILGLFSPLTAALNTYSAYLDGLRKFRLNNIFSVIATLFYVISMSIAVILGGEFIWLIGTYALITFLASALFYFATLRSLNPPETSADDTIKYGWKLTFIGLIGPVASQIDKIILAHYWGVVQLAVYSLAIVIPNRAITSIKALVNIGFPKFAASNVERINSVFYKRIFQGLMIGAISALAYILIAPLLFAYLLPQYLDSILYSQILAISMIFALPNRYTSLLFVAQKLSRLIFINSIIQNTLRIVLYVFFGIWGGILGLVIAQVLISLISLIINIAIWRLRKV